MERSVWTDERIDDMVSRLDSRFELIYAELREIRAELRESRAETHAIRRDMFHGMVALFGVLAGMWATMLVYVLA